MVPEEVNFQPPPDPPKVPTLLTFLPYWAFAETPVHLSRTTDISTEDASTLSWLFSLDFDASSTPGIEPFLPESDLEGNQSCCDVT